MDALNQHSYSRIRAQKLCNPAVGHEYALDNAAALLGHVQAERGLVFSRRAAHVLPAPNRGTAGCSALLVMCAPTCLHSRRRVAFYGLLDFHRNHRSSGECRMRLLNRREFNGLCVALSSSVTASGASALDAATGVASIDGRTVKFRDGTVVAALGQGSASFSEREDILKLLKKKRCARAFRSG